MGTISTIIDRQVIATRPDATVQETAQMMQSHRVGALVVMEKDKLVGIVSERDIVWKVLAKNKVAQSTKTSDIMTEGVKTVAEESDSDQALQMMHLNKIRHLPVINKKGKVIGMLSVRDLLRHRLNELNEENKSLSAYVAADGPGG